jgi:hypothetical protein
MKARKSSASSSTKPAAKRAMARKKPAAKPTMQTVQKKPVELSLNGWGFELEYIPISKKAFKRLTVDGVTNGQEFDKYLHGATMHTGARNGHCSLYLGNKKLGKTIRLKSAGANHRIGESAEYILVSNGGVKGDIRIIEIAKGFDKKLLTLDLARYEFSDGTTFDMVGFDYDSTESYDCDISFKGREVYVLTGDGKKHPVIFNDE